ncbi:MAG: hypothetical protein QOJ59_1821 [Thermomicrobiales bacterium]|nr:hypothetical protein [Thermomicrobiales bacterium]
MDTQDSPTMPATPTTSTMPATAGMVDKIDTAAAEWAPTAPTAPTAFSTPTAADRTDPRVAWLVDELQELQKERVACEQRVAEIDRVIGAAQIMLEELAKKASAVDGSLRQTGMFSVTPPQPDKPSRVYSRVRKPKPPKGRSDKPRQEDWLARWARDHDGIVRISDARPSFIAAGLTEAKPRNIYGNIMGVMNRSADFEQVDKGTFRWIPYEATVADGESPSATETHGDEATVTTRPRDI